MNLFRKIALSFRYGFDYMIPAGVVTMVLAFFVHVQPLNEPGYRICKWLTIPVFLYLVKHTGRKSTIYFYLNIGISRAEYYAIPIVMEYLIFELIFFLI